MRVNTEFFDTLFFLFFSGWCGRGKPAHQPQPAILHRLATNMPVAIFQNLSPHATRSQSHTIPPQARRAVGPDAGRRGGPPDAAVHRPHPTEAPPPPDRRTPTSPTPAETAAEPRGVWESTQGAGCRRVGERGGLPSPSHFSQPPQPFPKRLPNSRGLKSLPMFVAPVAMVVWRRWLC